MTNQRPAGLGYRFLPDASFDLATSTLVFHHLPVEAKEEAIAEAARLLRPGGELLLVDLEPLRPLRRPLRGPERQSTRLGLRTNTPQALAHVLRASGFAVEEVDPPRPWTLGRWTYALKATKP